MAVASKKILVGVLKRSERFYQVTQFIVGLILIPIWIRFFKDYSLTVAIVSGALIFARMVEELVKMLLNKKLKK